MEIPLLMHLDNVSLEVAINLSLNMFKAPTFHIDGSEYEGLHVRRLPGAC